MNFAATLAHYRSIFVDTAPIIYYIEAHPQFGPLAKQMIEIVQSGTLQAYSSVITLSEVLPKPIEHGDPALAKQFTTFLRNGINVMLVDVSADSAEAAGTLRGRYPALRTKDYLPE